MTTKAKVNGIIETLEEKYPDAKCSLEYEDDAWKLLVMARLSAQCTDARVNIVSKDLFKRFPDVYSMAEGELSDIESLVKPCGLYRTKAKSIKEMSEKLINDFDGNVPDTFDELMSLPGVGSKIANLMLGDVFGQNAIVADTHCIRISKRLGLSDGKNQHTVEKQLDKIIPKDKQSDFCHRLVLFGRDVCTARSPKCEACELKQKGLCKGTYFLERK